MRNLRMAHAIVRLYPRCWRIRYENELLALLREQPPSVAQLMDLLRGCGSEWGRLLADPVDYPRLSLVPREAVLGTMQIGSGLLFGLFVVGAGELLHDWRPPPVTLSGLSVATFVYLAVILRVLPAVKSRWTRYHVGTMESWLWLATIASSFVLERWIGGVPFAALDVIRASGCVWFLSTATPGSARAFETHRMLQAAHRDAYRIRLRLETTERYADHTGAELEDARTALTEVHERIRRHATELRRIPLVSLIGLIPVARAEGDAAFRKRAKRAP